MYQKLELPALNLHLNFRSSVRRIVMHFMIGYEGTNFMIGSEAFCLYIIPLERHHLATALIKFPFVGTGITNLQGSSRVSTLINRVSDLLVRSFVLCTCNSEIGSSSSVKGCDFHCGDLTQKYDNLNQ